MHDSENGIVVRAKHGLGLPSLYLCHRLDTVTSGCLLLAKHAEAAAELSGLFATRQIQKFYLAFLANKPAKKQGTISGDMKNRRRGQHILLKSKNNPAVTQFFSHYIESVGRIAVVKPLTGKTHQIRVAMKSIGAPIHGDTLYGASPADRVSLHAHSLFFEYKKETVSVAAPPTEGSLFTAKPCQNWLSAQSQMTRLPWPEYKFPRVKAPEDASHG